MNGAAAACMADVMVTKRTSARYNTRGDNTRAAGAHQKNSRRSHSRLCRGYVGIVASRGCMRQHSHAA